MKISIVGGGLFGLSSALEAARRGHQVTLHEAESIPGPRASSHDVSKALRHAYGEKTGFYGPLAARSIEGWRRLERDTGRSLFHQVGFLALSTRFEPGAFEFDSARELTRLGISHDVLDSREITRRFKAFSPSGASAALFDPAAGWLDADACVLALADAAVRAGATIRTGSSIADPANLEGDFVLVTAGPWLSKLLPTLSPGIRPSLQHEWFFRPREEVELPVWSFDIATLGYYGFPTLARSRDPVFAGTNKVATHLHGKAEDPDGARARDEDDAAATTEFVRLRLPFLEPRPVAHRPCFYANTLDGHFLFDFLPTDPRVVVAGGGSGHAFKFGPLLGGFALDVVEGKPIPREFGLARESGRTV